MEDRNFITLVIHTYERALVLKQVLESNGIDVRLQNVNQTEPSISSGIRVKIDEKDLPLALKIIESGEAISPTLYKTRLSGMSGNILIPIDFSEYSLMACKIGFAFAKTLKLHPVLLHAFVTPYFKGVLPFSDNTSVELREIDIRFKMEREAIKNMDELSSMLKNKIAEGEYPNIGFSTIIREGVPEEVICDYAKNSPPTIIIMATREKNKKEKDLIGSVTAEVMDSCRVPVFSVPEGMNQSDVDEIKNVVFFCNVEQQDLLAMDTFIRLFKKQAFNITIIPVNDRAGQQLNDNLEKMVSYFAMHYPESKYSYRIVSKKTFRKQVFQMINDEQIKLLVIPNKEKHIFSRLLNPSIAHKILFERDIPMLVLPI